jgi:hypothetical protein
MPGRKKSSEQIAEQRIAQRLLETATAQYLGDLLGPKDIRTYLAENPDMAEAVASLATQLMFAKIPDGTKSDS